MIKMICWGGTLDSVDEFRKEFKSYRSKIFISWEGERYELVVGIDNGSYAYVDIGVFICSLNDGPIFLLTEKQIHQIEQNILDVSKGTR